jgi:hypothetical protein
VFPLFSSLTRTIRERGITAVLDGLLSKRRSHGFVRAVFPDFFSETSDIDELVIPRFFDEISRYEADINFSLPSDELYQDTPLQKVYFPNTVGKKFLVDFPEAGLLYAKISHTKRFISLLKGDKERKKGAQEDLWKVGDFSLFCCSDLCQHGNDGQYPGSANAPLRNAAYKAMLEVERRTTREWHGWVPSLVSRDFDFDGALEYLFQGALVNCFVRQRGAAVFELDYLPAAWNYQNTIALATQIPRETESSFYDIIAPQNCTGNGEDAAPATVRRLGTEIWRQDDIDRKHLRIDFRLPARENGPWAALESHKEYKLCDNTLTVRYKLINTDAKQLNFSFITRLNLSFADDKDKMLRIFAYDTWQSFNNTSEKRPIALTSTGIQQVEAIDFQDINNELIVNVSSDSAFDSVIKQFSAPYKNALGEIIDQYQWTSIWPRKQITLNAGATTEFVFKVEFFK